MSFFRVLCVFLCVLCGDAFALDRNAFTFTDYDLEVSIVPPKSTLDAKGSITLRNDSSTPQNVAVLQVSSSLEWKTVTVGGKAVQFLTQEYTTDIDHTGALSEAIVNLPEPVPPQGTVKLEIHYAGEIAQDASRLTRIGAPEGRSLNTEWDRIADPYSIVRGVGYVAWYPIATEAASLSAGNELFQTLALHKQRQAAARMHLWMCVLYDRFRPIDVIMNDTPAQSLRGAHRNATEKPASYRQCTEHVFEPIGDKSPSFAIGRYVTSMQSVIRIDHLPGRAELAADYTRVAARVSALTQHWFGPRKRQVHLVELPSADYVPWESEAMWFAPLKPVPPAEMELSLAHPMAHASIDSPRPWISEGLAHFAQALQREQQDGRAAAIAYMQQQTGALITASSTDDEVLLQPLATATDELFFRTKAMRVWWMLRDLVGDEPLRRALQAYRPEQDREPSYVQRLVEAETKRDLEWFFSDWVYRDHKFPDFRLDSAYPRQTMSGVYIVTVTVENTGTAGAEVPVSLVTDRGEVTKRILVPAQQKSVIRIEAPSKPVRVVVNDGSVPEWDTSNNSFDIKP